jgi:hypothetical protein
MNKYAANQAIYTCMPTLDEAEETVAPRCQPHTSLRNTVNGQRDGPE